MRCISPVPTRGWEIWMPYPTTNSSLPSICPTYQRWRSIAAPCVTIVPDAPSSFQRRCVPPVPRCMFMPGSAPPVSTAPPAPNPKSAPTNPAPAATSAPSLFPHPHINAFIFISPIQRIFVSLQNYCAHTHTYMRIKYNGKVLRYRLVTHDIKHISLMPFLLLNRLLETWGYGQCRK